MSMFKKKPIILIDGSSYLFRAYYALPALTNSKGLPTGAIYGVINMLQKLIKEYSPAHIAVIFDPKGKTTRHKVYPEYKANRTAMPDELAQQIPYLHRVVEALGLPLIIEPGIEADDLIGTLAKRAVAKRMSVLISTGDKDMAQLVNKNVSLINTMKNEVLDIDGVIKKYGVAPEQIIDYLALMGDTSDNIPGVNKVGPKTAVKWLDEYISVQNIIDSASEFSGKVGENLRTAIADGSLAMAEHLVTIDCDIDSPADPLELRLQAADTEQLHALYKELEFTKLLNGIDSTEKTVEDHPTIESEYATILTMEQWQPWFDKLMAADVFALDTETTSINAMQAELVGLSVAVSAGEAAYIPLGHDYMGAPQQCERALILAQLSQVMADQSKTWVGHNIKYDLHVLQRSGLTVNNTLWDTMIASYVLNPTNRGHKLDTLAQNLLGHRMISFEDVAGKGAKQLTFNQVAIDVASEYAAEDADMTLRLYTLLQQKLTTKTDKRVFHSIDMPVMSILQQMEHCGVRLDSALLQQQSDELATTLDQLQQKIYQEAGEHFNISSPKQLQVILFDNLKLPVLKKTPKGQPSTSEEVLQQLSMDYALPSLILEYRSALKLKNTYTDKLPLQVNEHTGRVHTQYNQTATTTGRLSSNSPNLQNIPVRTADGRRVRQAFIAAGDRVIVAADYSQVELRIIAHLSQDPSLMQAFELNLDVHSATAAEVFSVSIDDVSAEQRRRAKAINFGLMYGMSAFGLAKQLGISREDASQYIDIYFQRYPKVLEYLETTRESAKAKGYVETMTGRRLPTPDVTSSNGLRRKAAERAAINAPLQGSAADIIKLAMLNCVPWLSEYQQTVSLLLQVHDELVFSVDRSVLDEVLIKVKESMQSAIEMSVPLIVECGVGENWDAAH
jgi:DNA polymerase I